MKKFFSLIFYFISIFILIVVFTCSTSERNTNGKIAEKEIIGKWRAVEKYGTEIDPDGRVQSIFIFNDDYSLESIYLEKAKQRKGVGTWQLSFEDDDNVLYVKFENEREKFDVSLEENKLVLREFDSKTPMWKFIMD